VDAALELRQDDMFYASRMRQALGAVRAREVSVHLIDLLDVLARTTRGQYLARARGDLAIVGFL